MSKSRLMFTDPVLYILRLQKPHKRVENDWTTHGSGSSVRRAYCAYCEDLIDTCSAKWRPTKTFEKNIEGHTHACRARFVKGLSRKWKRELKRLKGLAALNSIDWK